MYIVTPGCGGHHSFKTSFANAIGMLKARFVSLPKILTKFGFPVKMQGIVNS